ncbi:MAG: hypothetical protein K940chlam8_00990 [Chlamydiae bacterium]|nr:hypothetical protein [Chlamydiota bacterium]
MSVEAVSNPGLNFEQVEAVNDYVENLIFYQKDGIDFERTITNLLQGPQTPEVKECLARVFALTCPISNAMKFWQEVCKNENIDEKVFFQSYYNNVFFALWYRFNQQLGVALPIDMQFDSKALQDIKENRAPWMNMLINEYKRLVESDQMEGVLDRAIEVYSKDQQKRLAMQFLTLTVYLDSVDNLEDARFYVRQLSVCASLLGRLEPEIQKELFGNILFTKAVTSIEDAFKDMICDKIPLHKLQPLLEDTYQILSVLLELSSNNVELELSSVQRVMLRICLLRGDKDNLQKYLNTSSNKVILKFANFGRFRHSGKDLEYLYKNDAKTTNEMVDFLIEYLEAKVNNISENFDAHEKKQILESCLGCMHIRASAAFEVYKETHNQEYLLEAVASRKQLLDKKEEYDLPSFCISYEVEYEIDYEARNSGLLEAI